MSERLMLNDFVEMVGPQGSVERLLGSYRKEILDLRESESQLSRRVRWLEEIILQATSHENLHLEFSISKFCYLKPLREPDKNSSVIDLLGGVLTVKPTPEDFK